MNHHRTLSTAGIVFIALMAGLLLISAHAPSSALPGSPETADIHHPVSTDMTHHETPHSYPAGRTHEDFALTDMYAYAVAHLGSFSELPDSLDETPDWYGWELQWIDVEHNGEVVRIYHATENQHHEIRFVTMWDSHHPRPAGWELAN